MISYGLRFTPTAMTIFTKLHPDIKKRIRLALKEIVASPYTGKELQAELIGYRTCKTARYRVIYRVNEPEECIDVIYIGHRRDVYEQLRSLLHGPFSDPKD